MCRVSKYVEARRVLQRSVAVSKADVDASKKPITVQNTEVAFSALFTVMGLLLASTSTSETATNAVLPALSFDTSSKSESHSQSFLGHFNSLGNFAIVHKSERGLGKEDKSPVHS